MTRDYAMFKMEVHDVGRACRTDATADVVNKIFDHFENRSCESCKKLGTNSEYVWCQDIWNCDGHCNNWEKKDE